MNFYNRILMDNDGSDGGSGDDNNDDDPDNKGGGAGKVSMTEAELKEIRNRSYRNGKRDEKARLDQKYLGVLEELGIKPVDNDIEKSIRAAGETLKTSGKEESEKLQLANSRAEKLQTQVKDLEKQLATSADEKNNFIIQTEFQQALGDNVIDRKAALRLILSDSGRKFKVQDGKVKIYNQYDEPDTNAKGDEMTASDVVAEFLKEKSYLVKTDQKTTELSQKGINGQRGGSSMGGKITQSDYKKLPPDELEKALNNIALGKLEVVADAA